MVGQVRDFSSDLMHMGRTTSERKEQNPLRFGGSSGSSGKPCAEL